MASLSLLEFSSASPPPSVVSRSDSPKPTDDYPVYPFAPKPDDKNNDPEPPYGFPDIVIEVDEGSSVGNITGNEELQLLSWVSTDWLVPAEVSPDKIFGKDFFEDFQKAFEDFQKPFESAIPDDFESNIPDGFDFKSFFPDDYDLDNFSPDDFDFDFDNLFPDGFDFGKFFPPSGVYPSPTPASTKPSQTTLATVTVPVKYTGSYVYKYPPFTKPSY